ncbi:stage II sporulation protein M [Natronorubrum daqingense]|uniref:Stage II sporulation protein M n=1 Tax=Natronorubrum daqingense TaxID=588898 RepID=A0A1N7CTA0_9EURY|nr:stage II sporulation protein M [Natronorubrum daqingense]APX97052.1 hypothetical protein BB347_10695 [Natronorubrum daqingense]SIR66832.1 Stage II sporulation protein M [Natronorubrum daqingense]
MSLSDSITAAVAVFRRRPSDFLPWYLLGAAIPAIVRLVPFLAVVVGYLYLELTGRLAVMHDSLGQIDGSPPDQHADQEAFDEWAGGFEPVFEQLFTPTMALIVLATIIVSVGLILVLFPFVSAGQLTACSARLIDKRGLTAGIAGARRYWLRFLGLYILEFLLWVGAVIAVGMGVAFTATVVTALTGEGLLAGVFAVVALFGFIAVLAAIRAVFAFAPVAVVVDDTTTFASVSNAASFIWSSPVAAGFYYLITIGSMIAVSTVSGVLVFFDVVAFSSLLTMILLFPFLDLLKVALYNDYRNRLAPPSTPDRTLRRQFKSGMGRGWREMTTFIRQSLGTHALVVALGLLSFWVGWEAAEPIANAGLETSISARLEDHNPLAATLEFFGNNWMVALTTAFSGVALVAPAIASLVFNGLFLGFHGRTEVEPLELLAFVIPHGIFEIPAIFIATAVGVWLGRIWWRALRGRASRVEFADALERTFWVLVGVGILLAIAAAIEGFLSPYYFQPFV